MIRQVCRDKKYAEYTGLAIRVAYEVYWYSGVDVYDSDKELKEAIFSRVEEWNELRKDLLLSSSLQRAGRLLHKTKSDVAFVEIERAIVKMFGQWRRPPSSAPVQLRFLLATAAECRAREGILFLAVFSSPHFSDSEFTKILLNRLANISALEISEWLIWRCFVSVSFAPLIWKRLMTVSVEEVSLSRELFSSLQERFQGRGAPMDELRELVMHGALDMLRGFGGQPETMTKLRERLSQPQYTKAVNQDHLSWAVRALDQVLNPTAPFKPRFLKSGSTSRRASYAG
ncbi:hypothetical protein EI94DRAFT_1835233 [Lactarius quietus]|nr:hypothetical protein EI94DRAFT_1835233 [Lactarius quietus]